MGTASGTTFAEGNMISASTKFPRFLEEAQVAMSRLGHAAMPNHNKTRFKFGVTHGPSTLHRPKLNLAFGWCVNGAP